LPVFKDKGLVEEMFGEIWNKMVHETEFGPKLKENGISIFFVVSDPDVAMYVDENGPVFGEEAKSRMPVVTMKMSADNVHKFWLNRLNIPKALALRQIKAKGPVGKVLQVIPLIKPAKVMYSDYCEKYNLPMNV
jgi:putative sterol carrier protein